MEYTYDISNEDKICIESDEFIIIVNENKPIFTDDDKKQLEGSIKPVLNLAELKGCRVALACISKKTLSSGQDERPKIQSKPSGFPASEKENSVNERLIFQRCHLIGHHLFAKMNDEDKKDANLKRIFTGTRFMNNEMLYYENKIANYVSKDEERKVYYRVTLHSEVKNKVAYGVQLEAKFTDKDGNEAKDLSFNVFIYNKQPDIRFEYKSGEILKDESINLSERMSKTDRDYVINKRSKKFHLKCCASVRYINEERKREFFGKRDDLINGDKIEFKSRPCEICDSGVKKTGVYIRK